MLNHTVLDRMIPGQRHQQAPPARNHTVLDRMVPGRGRLLMALAGNHTIKDRMVKHNKPSGPESLPEARNSVTNSQIVRACDPGATPSGLDGGGIGPDRAD